MAYARREVVLTAESGSRWLVCTGQRVRFADDDRDAVLFAREVGGDEDVIFALPADALHALLDVARAAEGGA